MADIDKGCLWAIGTIASGERDAHRCGGDQDLLTPGHVAFVDVTTTLPLHLMAALTLPLNSNPHRYGALF